ncbi:MAG TPA: DUF4388 domain-containing protein [Desulfuromonadales bacterium]|nr:DUF4388 domain-containing protein [Desulfuromonadales bacterium]
MSLTGDLEHLPIVDVIQLMNSTRKSGILNINGRKGESQLVFKDGFIVSASHLNNSVRIGEVLLKRGAITEEALEKALEEQSKAGDDRAPLVVTLLEMGILEEHEAYKGLHELIEMTIIEILTWKKGAFLLEANLAKTPDNYQYYPKNIKREINVDTQSVLMDALRIFDEKVRDGQLDFEDDGEEETEITADDLGLSDMEQLERKIPGVYAGLDERTSSSDAGSDPSGQGNLVRHLNEVIAELDGLGSAPEIALAQLRFAAKVFPRALTLVVRKGELVVEKSLGVERTKPGEVAPPMDLHIPFDESSLLSRAVKRGEFYYGPFDDFIAGQLYARIGAPAAGKMALLPVKCAGRTVFLTYADFGAEQEYEVPEELLKMLADQTGEALERMLKRRKSAS